MVDFVKNTNITYLDYYDSSSNQINLVTSYPGIQSKSIYIASSIPVLSSLIDRNINFQSNNQYLLTNPAILNYFAGSNPTSITFSSSTPSVQYVYFSKSGDGAYYSNLPPLTVITDLSYYQSISFINMQYSIPIASIGTNYSIILTLP